MNTPHGSKLAHRLPFLIAFGLPMVGSAHPGHEELPGDRSVVPPFFLAQAHALNRGETPAPPSSSPMESRVTVTIDGDYRIIRSNGWPDHQPGAFPRRGNPNRASPQDYTFRVPLKPVVSSRPERSDGWWWGVALNGVPFEPGTGETWNHDHRWRYEAATGFLDLGLDENNAHVQPSGAYHYHALPTGLVNRLGGDGKKMLLVGWAADGFPLYTSWAYAEAANPGGGLRKMKSSYRLRSGTRPASPGGPGGNYDGRFTQDFEYAKGSGDLDEFNGRAGVTPEFPGGTYYYCISAEFPFLPRLWKGTPDPSFEKGDRPLGGGPGGPRGPGGMRPLGFAPGSGFPPPLPIFEVLDRNHDGILDTGEVAGATQALKQLDRNSDGRLTADEYLPLRPPRGAGSVP